MPLTMEDRERIEAFRSYVEDYVATDDRYGTAARHDNEQKMLFATRFELAPACWFEVAVMADAARIRVSFLTSDKTRTEIIEETIAESGGSDEQYLAGAFAEAGLDWPDPTMTKLTQDGLFSYSSEIRLDELRDLDSEENRDKTLRMLEGFLLAFAPALMVEEEAD